MSKQTKIQYVDFFSYLTPVKRPDQQKLKGSRMDGDQQMALEQGLEHGSARLVPVAQQLPAPAAQQLVPPVNGLIVNKKKTLTKSNKWNTGLPCGVIEFLSRPVVQH